MTLSLSPYATLEFEEAKTFKPWIIFPNENDNSLTYHLKTSFLQLTAVS
jgi:hypothetical protein